MFKHNTLLKFNSPSGPAQIRVCSEHHGIAGDLGAELAMLPPWVCTHCLMGCPQCLAPAPDSCTTGHPPLVKRQDWDHGGSEPRVKAFGDPLGDPFRGCR